MNRPKAEIIGERIAEALLKAGVSRFSIALVVDNIFHCRNMATNKFRRHLIEHLRFAIKRNRARGEGIDE